MAGSTHSLSRLEQNHYRAAAAAAGVTRKSGHLIPSSDHTGAPRAFAGRCVPRRAEG